MINLSLYKEPIKSNLVFISGLTRSGKALLCPIISSFNNTEKVNVNFPLEQIPALNYLGSINDETSKYLLRSGLNMQVYDNAIGRNSNFRTDDYTSVWKYRDPMEYINRLFQPDGDTVLTNLAAQGRIFPMMVHNGLWHADIWFKALPSVKFIHMQRNPVDIVFSWIGKGYGGEFYNSTRNNTVTYKYKENILPYYAYGWEEEYLSHNKIDRIIYMVSRIRNCHQDSYDRLNNDNKKRILFIRHQGLITETDKNLQAISNFIGESPSVDTPSVLLQQNCPRSPSAATPFSTSNKSFKEKLKEIKELSSPEAYRILVDMDKQFESKQLAI